MKKILFAATFACVMGGINAQELTEPDFIGECLWLKPDQTTELLEKNTTQTRSAAGASVYLVGIGSMKSKIQIDGCCAATKINSNSDVQFIVRAVDNNTDPLAIIRIFEFDSTKKIRRAEVASVNTFGTTKTNKLKYIPFSGKKYGKNSYLITLKDKPSGEYGIIVTNPNALDEKSTIVSSFSLK